MDLFLLPFHLRFRLLLLSLKKNQFLPQNMTIFVLFSASTVEEDIDSAGGEPAKGFGFGEKKVERDLEVLLGSVFSKAKQAKQVLYDWCLGFVGVLKI